jgi:hypothetical protein
MNEIQIIKDSMEELMKNRALMRTQLQKIDLLLRVLGNELQKHEASAETRIAGE